jgi:hypothetical protein
MSPEVRLAEPAVLARRLIDDTGPPIDTWAVAALLESRGIRDLDARDHYREADVFGLARRVHALTRGLDRASAAPDFVHAPLPRLPVSRLLARGGFFIVALAVQFISLLVVGYSQWASLHFTRAEASTVAVAAAASFIVTAGFGGAIGYLSPYFSEPRKYRLTRQIVLIIFGLGLIAVAVGALALCLLGSYVVSWPGSLLRAGLGYYALFAVSTLSISMLYVLREYAAMLGTSIVGILVAAGMHEGLSAPIRYAQWAGIGASIALALGVGVVGLGGWPAGQLVWSGSLVSHARGHSCASRRRTSSSRRCTSRSWWRTGSLAGRRATILSPCGFRPPMSLAWTGRWSPWLSDSPSSRSRSRPWRVS